MNRRIAMGVFAFAAMFAGSATADDFIKPGLTNVTIQHKSKPDPTVHIIVSKGKDKNGDAIVTIQKSKEEKVSLRADGDKVSWGAPSQWILHKNASGWSVMLESNGAMAVSLVNGELVLQRNQGAAHQMWEIEKK